MSFVNNVIGGVAIMIVATIIGVAHNAVRSKPIRGGLFPRVSTPSAPQPAVTPATSTNDERTEAEPAPATDMNSSSPGITSEEFATGELTVERVRTVLESGDVILIDARSESEFAEGHLPGAVNIPFDQFVDYIDYVDSSVSLDSPIICYCRSVTCDLSDQLAQELRLMGYEKVVVYRGGWDEWIDAGLSTEPGQEN
jgi:rhodanese-related sulfurtransferase